MLAEERHRKICETVLSRGTVTTVELMELLDASESTVRRDLAELEQRRRLVRVHGGASRIGNGYVLRDQALDEKHFLHAGEKQTIASFAASLIKPGDFVYLDAGSTTEALADCIEERDATYLTNSLPIARKLLARGCKTLLPGGTVKPLTEALVGEETIASLTKYHFTIGFWGTNGADPENGFTTPGFGESAVKQVSLEHTMRPYVICDSSKFKTISLIKFANFDDATIITDRVDELGYHEVGNIVEVMREGALSS